MPHIPEVVRSSPIQKRVEAVLGPAREGKVRRMWDLGEYMLMLATNCISAFDYVTPDYIDQKGEVLTALTVNWTKVIHADIKHHLLAAGGSIDDYLVGNARVLRNNPELQKVAVVVQKLRPLPIECIGREVLTGSGWKDYCTDKGVVCGQQLRPGLQDGDLLDQPIFTPSTKADVGHDVNISLDEAGSIVGGGVVGRCGELTLELLRRANDITNPRGMRVADTKFEFGLNERGDIVLIDEILTPDSSRFMVEDDRLLAIAENRTPPSLDKQFVRDYLEKAGFKKMSQAERDRFHMPEEILRQTSGIYLTTAYSLLGKTLDTYQHEDLGIAAP